MDGILKMFQKISALQNFVKLHFKKIVDFLNLFLLNYRTPELSKLAVEEEDEFVLKFVSKKLRTFELCKIAIEEDSQLFEFVPKKNKNS